MPIIHQISKELGISAEAIMRACDELSLTDKSSPLAYISDSDFLQIKRHLSLESSDLAVGNEAMKELFGADSELIDDQRAAEDNYTLVFEVGARVPGSRYILRERLGSGGFGSVWKADDEDTGTTLALKFCSDPSHVVTIRNEYDKLSQIRRKSGSLEGFTHVYGWQEHPNPFVAFEFVPGQNLHDYLAQRYAANDFLSLEEIEEIVFSLLQIVQRFHQLSDPIAHRDLKPSNIMIEDDEPEPPFKLRVIDFGLGVMSVEESQMLSRTDVGRTFRGGTTAYMSPEQFHPGHRGDPADDVHAIGVMWYEMLIGKLGVFDSRPVSTCWPEILERLGKRLSSKTQIDLVYSCLQLRHDRPRDAGALLEQFEVAFPNPNSTAVNDYNEVIRLRQRGDDWIGWLAESANKHAGIWGKAHRRGNPEAKWLLGHCWENGIRTKEKGVRLTSAAWFYQKRQRRDSLGRNTILLCTMNSESVANFEANQTTSAGYEPPRSRIKSTRCTTWDSIFAIRTKVPARV